MIRQPTSFIRFFVERSFFLNRVYWKLYRKGFGSAYQDYLYKAYHDHDIWSLHKQELLEFVKYAGRTGSEIAFIIWPDLRDIKASSLNTSRVADFLKKTGVKVIELGEYFEKRKPELLTINSMDGHPNEMVHAEVAQLVYTLLSPRD